MDTDFSLSEYMNRAIDNLVSDVIRSSLKNPKETAFLLGRRKVLKEHRKRKTAREKDGLNVPAFLIASITSRCNLNCKGCYARANGTCGEQKEEEMLSAAEWRDIFGQAADLGISFILLVGGEPLLRQDVLREAAGIHEIIFPVFTNGTLIDDDCLRLMDAHRNIVPILSIEGNQQLTDERRGTGVYDHLLGIMRAISKYKLLFGCSITVTTENLPEVTSHEFLDVLYKYGCRLIFYIEYVPVDRDTQQLAPGERERMILELKQAELRKAYGNLIFLSFPGDEKHMGGCIAAGRGFFHINSCGGAEACPFSPYSDRNLRDHTLTEVLQSPFFKKLRDVQLTDGDHTGGCVLFDREEQVKLLLKP